MDKLLIRQAGCLPSHILELFAKECGIEYADFNALMELQAIILEEIVDKDVDELSVVSAFDVVKETVTRRWTKWLQDSVSDAYDV